MFLSAYDLTPTYKNVNNKFSVKYFLNLVLVDEDDRRYFKQQEVQLVRASAPSVPPSDAQQYRHSIF
jgi:vacuolar protein sorting-associated protein 26